MGGDLVSDSVGLICVFVYVIDDDMNRIDAWCGSRRHSTGPLHSRQG